MTLVAAWLGVLIVALCVWALLGALHGVLAGLFVLTRHYEDRSEEPLRRFSWQIVWLGAGQNYKGVLRMRLFPVAVAACPSGLRVSVPRYFTPFGRRFMVPWGDIAVDRTWAWLSTVKQTFGHPPVGAVWIYPHVASQFANAVGDRWPEVQPKTAANTVPDAST